MNLLVLGRGKTGSLVAEVARERGHRVRAADENENRDGAAVTREALADVDVVVDFTAPHAVMGNIEACVSAGRNMVVGTTGWYDKLPQVKELVEQADIGLVWGGNFSVGVNLFFQAVRAAATALGQGYTGRILERHHVQKKDAPSGTALAMANILRAESGVPVEIASEREGDVVGYHQLTLDSGNDVITLAHDAHSRRGFAVGAVRAAEWLQGRRGFFEFREIFQQLR